jgi:hypothetical protein
MAVVEGPEHVLDQGRRAFPVHDVSVASVLPQLSLQ